MHLVSRLESSSPFVGREAGLDGPVERTQRRANDDILDYIWLVNAEQQDPIQLTSHTRNIRLSDSNNLHKSREEPDNTPGALDDDDDQHSTTTARLLIIMLLLLLHHNLHIILFALKLLLSQASCGFSICLGYRSKPGSDILF